MNRPEHGQQHCYHHDTKVKPEAATAVVELLMMGVRTPETCWTVNKHQDNKLEKLSNLVGDLYEFELLVCFLCSVRRSRIEPGRVKSSVTRMLQRQSPLALLGSTRFIQCDMYRGLLVKSLHTSSPVFTLQLRWIMPPAMKSFINGT
jgi:hypothetical protein